MLNGGLFYCFGLLRRKVNLQHDMPCLSHIYYSRPRSFDVNVNMFQLNDYNMSNIYNY